MIVCWEVAVGLLRLLSSPQGAPAVDSLREVATWTSAAVSNMSRDVAVGMVIGSSDGQIETSKDEDLALLAQTSSGLMLIQRDVFMDLGGVSEVSSSTFVAFVYVHWGSDVATAIFGNRCLLSSGVLRIKDILGIYPNHMGSSVRHLHDFLNINEM